MRRTLLLTAALLTMVLGTRAQYTRKTNLPAVYIETFDRAPVTSKDFYKYCRLYYVDENDQLTAYDSVSIRGRGNSTWNMAKKPYKLKFNNKEKLLGKGYAKAKKWTLLANAGDKTMMRNAVTSAMGAFTSLKFNPAAKFVDLVLNNAYQGTYQISDQIDVRPHRVDIAEQPYPLASGDDITGGYLLEVDGFRDGNVVTTSHYQAPVRIHYPDEDEIVARQTNYIRNYLNNFENRLTAIDFADPEKGYRAVVDTASLIDWYICTEVSANIDGFYSTYFYKDKQDPKLYWGPLWDYDIAYNNDHRVRSEQGLSTTAEAMMADIGYNGSKAWVMRMWEDPWFQQTVSRRFDELMDRGLVDHLHQHIDSLHALLGESQRLNYNRWGINTRMYHEMVLYSSYDQYVADLKDFIVSHCDYLRQAFADRRPPEPFVAGNFYYRIVNARTGKAIDSNATQHSATAGRESLDWQLVNLGEYYQIINRSTGLALNDPTSGVVGPTVNVGTTLNTVAPNANSRRQQWMIVAQPQNLFNLVNVYSQHVANLQGGAQADGTPVMSYTNDSRNSVSQNRLWRIVEGDALPAELTAVSAPEPEAYALAYDASTRRLHFGSSTPEALTFTVSVATLSGAAVATFTAADGCTLPSVPSGVYVVSWTVGGKRRSAKLVVK